MWGVGLGEAGDQTRGKLLEAANREYDLVRLSLSFFLFLFLSLSTCSLSVSLSLFLNLLSISFTQTLSPTHSPSLPLRLSRALDEAGDQKRGKLLEAANREYDLVCHLSLSLSFSLSLSLSLSLSSGMRGLGSGRAGCRV